MAEHPLVSRREEAQALRLAGGQPRSSPALQRLIETVRERTVVAVVRDQRVTERLAGARYRVVGAGLREEKPEAEGQAARRLGEVGLYDYDRNTLIVAVVDLRAGTVVEIEERTDLQPPLSEEEIEEARELVLADEQYRAVRRHRDLQVVALPARAAFTDTRRFRGHRLCVLTFWTGVERPHKVGEAAVDLSAQTLVPLEEAQAFNRQGDQP